MFKDLLRIVQSQKSAASPSEAARKTISGKTNTTSAKKSSPDAEAVKRSRRDKLVFIGLTIAVIVPYTIIQNLSNTSHDGANQTESVIPLAQLTGKIGAQPRTLTPEQQFRRDNNKNVLLSDGKTIPANVVQERTNLFRQVPFGDTELAYEMRLPTSWGQSRFTQYGSPTAEKYKVLTNIDRFFGPSLEDKRPFVWMEVEALDRLVTAEQYMNQYLIKRGITPEAVKVYDGTRAETLFIQSRDYSSFVVRALFVMNGDRLMLITFGVPIEEYKNYKDIMGLTLSSYRMLQTIERQPEPVASYKLLNVLTFDYPSRWQTRNQNRTSSLNPSVELVLPTELQVAVDNVNHIQQIEGLILVNAWRNSPLFNRAVLEETIVKRLQQNRLKLEAVLQPDQALPTHDGMLRMSQAIYIGRIDIAAPTTEEFGIIQDTTGNPRQEIWVTTLDNGDYTAAITLLTWPQTKNYVNWSYNVAAYQKIIDTLKLRQSIY